MATSYSELKEGRLFDNRVLKVDQPVLTWVRTARKYSSTVNHGTCGPAETGTRTPATVREYCAVLTRPSLSNVALCYELNPMHGLAYGDGYETVP